MLGVQREPLLVNTMMIVCNVYPLSLFLVAIVDSCCFFSTRFLCVYWKQ